MKKIEILTSPLSAKSSHNQGYAIYVEGKKVWESKSNFDATHGEQIKVDDLLSALGFKFHVIEITDKVIDENYGIFPDELHELDKYSKEEKFEKENIQNVIPGDEYIFDDVYYDEDLNENDEMAYNDDDYDLPDFDGHNIEWVDIDDVYNEEDYDNWE